MIRRPNRRQTDIDQAAFTVPTMAAFILNPYDGVLNLSDKNDWKLLQDACKGLPEDHKFDGKKTG